MSNIQPTDRFLVDRLGTTYKTTFSEIEESLDIDVSHDYNAEVDETLGGQIETFVIDNPGTGFLEGLTYIATDGTIQFTFDVTSASDTGEIQSIEIVSNDPIDPFDPASVFTSSSITEEGSVAEILTIADYPSLSANTSVRYRIRQTRSFPDIDENNDTIGYYDELNTSAEVEISFDGTDYTQRVTRRGSAYVDNIVAYLEVTDIDDNTSDGEQITFTVADPDTSTYVDAEFRVTEIKDGVDSDKAKLTVTVGGVEKSIYLVPGRGIAFNNMEDNDDGSDQIEILNTITEFGEGGGGISDGATVIVSPDVPTVQVYNIKDGTLWYNLLDGRLYIAVTYLGASGTEFDWIDASPSSFNDSLRKNQDDNTYYNLRVERNESLNPDGGSFFAYHFNLEELPLIS